MGTDWSAIFGTFKTQVGATPDDVARLVEDLRRPVGPDDRRRIIDSQSNPWLPGDEFYAGWTPLDPVAWRLPTAPLPASWLDFLAWSNGCLATNGEMEFGFFGTSEIREFILGYHLPAYMPFAVPLGLDGSGNIALLDVREPMTDLEYPIVVAAAGNLGFDEARPLASDFESFCRITKRIEKILYP
ncbi:MAG: SMI1/KNR4 family protein [Polyangiaceae bacterium]|nr:SMI1/KNR4 family protein [Polyangiaceae bacterium]